MKKALLGASALVCAALLVSSAAEAKKTVTYVPVVPPPGAVSTTAFGINDSNIIAGSFTDSSGVEHGFFGPLDGSNYTEFDAIAGQTGTEPRAIANDGSIDGLAQGGAFVFGEEWFRSPDGTIKPLKKKKLLFDGVAQGFNGSDLFMGDYVDSTGTRVGYQGANGKYKTGFSLPVDAISTNPRGINDSGVVAGGFIDTAGVQHGFTLDGSTLNVIDFPGAAGITVAEGINNGGVVSGLWQDSSGNRHGFVYDSSTGDLTAIEGNDGSTFQQIWGINNQGLIVLNTQQSDGTYKSYIYCPLKKKKCPKGGTEAEVQPIHVAPGTFLHYDKNGRTNRNLPAAKPTKVHAAIP